MTKFGCPLTIVTNQIHFINDIINRLKVQNNVRENQWNIYMWNQQKHTEKKIQFGNYVLWFPKKEKTYLGKFKKR